MDDVVWWSEDEMSWGGRRDENLLFFEKKFNCFKIRKIMIRIYF